MAEDQDALIRQVDEELRREQLAKLWEKYGNLIIGAAAAIVIGVGGFKWYEGRKIAAAEAAGARFESAAKLAQEGKGSDALKAFEDLAKTGPKGYAALAGLRVAAGLAQAGKSAEAVAAYDAVAKEPGSDQMLADLARLQAANLRLQQADWTEMQNRLTDLAGEKSAWRFSARELLGLAAFKAGKLDEARKAYEQLLADRRAPPSIGERSRMMMAEVVAAEMAKQTAAPAVAPPEPAKPREPAKAAEPAPAKGKK